MNNNIGVVRNKSDTTRFSFEKRDHRVSITSATVIAAKLDRFQR